MRLIDADALVANLISKTINGESVEMFSFINEQPTAFDVNKVIEEFKEETVIGADCIGNGFECIPTFKAIEIVKKGGQNGISRVLETKGKNV